MFDLSQPVFGFRYPDIIFVQDFLLSDLIGGAELSMDALHKASPVPFTVIRSQQLKNEHFKNYKDKHWIFGNFAGIHPQAIAYISDHFSYSIYEHDYKFCNYRSIEKHRLEEGHDCDCGAGPRGELIKKFFINAKKVWWCSQGQLNRYIEHIPQIVEANNEVLSATFGEDFFENVRPLISSLPSIKKEGWVTLDSDSWIKGTEDAISWLESNGKQYKLLKNLSHKEMLAELSRAEGFVCLPRGGDVSNRMVTEAKLLGCEVVHNDNVQHASEEWLNNPDKQFILNWLYDRRKVFWDQTTQFIK